MEFQLDVSAAYLRNAKKGGQSKITKSSAPRKKDLLRCQGTASMIRYIRKGKGTRTRESRAAQAYFGERGENFQGRLTVSSTSE